MASQGPRAKAVKSWDAAISNLKSSVTQYSFQSLLLFNHLNHEIEDTEDLPLEDALLHIDKQLIEISRAQEQLQKSKTRMQSYRNNSTSLVLIHRLPPEILLHIITLGVEEDIEMKRQQRRFFEEEEIQRWEDDDELHPDPPDGYIPHDWRALDKIPHTHPDYKLQAYESPPYLPSICSQVCRRWRKLSLSKASFWTKIQLIEDPEYLAEMIRRTKLLPIDLDMNVLTDTPETKTTQLSTISQHASRIKSLEVVSMERDNFEDFLRCIVPDAELSTYSLRAVTLGMGYSQRNRSPLIKLEDVVEGVDPAVIDGLLSGIRELQLTVISFDWESKAFQNLTLLRLDFMDHPSAPTSEQIYAILSGSPQLQSLELNAIMMLEPAEPSLPLQRIHLDSLHTFGLREVSDDGPSLLGTLLLSVIYAPNLARLLLYGLSGVNNALAIFLKPPEGSAVNAIVPFDELEYLRISSCQIGPTTLRRLLGSMPNIKDLGIRNTPHFGDHLVRDMILDPTVDSGHRMLPNLKTLRLVGCCSIKSYEILKELISSRNPHEGAGSENSLQKLVFKWGGFGISNTRRRWFEKNVDTFIYKNYPRAWAIYDSDIGSDDDEEVDEDDGGDALDSTDADEIEAALGPEESEEDEVGSDESNGLIDGDWD
ncbi:hypothetical protein FRC03_002982 [Tulasnella sp. 419]|nr:hypothetical protein FRC03_002982 [Tulasnella sp. 419]